MTAHEAWVSVLGYEGFYEVSDLGRVRSVDREITHRNGVRRMYAGQLLVPGITSNGRRSVSLCRGGKDASRTRFVAHLVAEAFIGPRPGGMHVCHNDGDQINDALSNLRWDTRSENIRDAVRHGTHRETRKTHCPRNHLLSAPNLCAYAVRGGTRRCLACDRTHKARGRARERGQVIDFPTEADRQYRLIMAAQPDEETRRAKEGAR